MLWSKRKKARQKEHVMRQNWAKDWPQFYRRPNMVEFKMISFSNHPKRDRNMILRTISDPACFDTTLTCDGHKNIGYMASTCLG